MIERKERREIGFPYHHIRPVIACCITLFRAVSANVTMDQTKTISLLVP